MKRRRFTKEFKLEILMELESKTLAQVCREHDLVPNVIGRSVGGKKSMITILIRHSAVMVTYGKNLQKLRNISAL